MRSKKKEFLKATNLLVGAYCKAVGIDPDDPVMKSFDDYNQAIWKYFEVQYTSQREEFVKDLKEMYNIGVEAVSFNDTFGWQIHMDKRRKLISKYKKNEK